MRKSSPLLIKKPKPEPVLVLFIVGAVMFSLTILALLFVK